MLAMFLSQAHSFSIDYIRNIFVHFRELKSICRALLKNRDKIPESRLNDLRQRLKEMCPDVTDFSDEFLQSYNDIDTT